MRAVGFGTATVVKLKCGDSEVPTRLVDHKLHIPTVKDLFGLSSVLVDGVAEPADDRGLPFTTYLSGNILQISGTPTAGWFIPLDVLCYSADTVLLCAYLKQGQVTYRRSQWLFQASSAMSSLTYLPTQPLHDGIYGLRHIQLVCNFTASERFAWFVCRPSYLPKWLHRN